MKKRKVVLLLLLFYFFFFFKVFVFAETKPQSRPPSEGRYTIIEASGHTFFVDTQLGKAWRYYRNTDENNKLKDEGWTYLEFNVYGTKYSDFNTAIQSVNVWIEDFKKFEEENAKEFRQNLALAATPIFKSWEQSFGIEYSSETNKYVSRDGNQYDFKDLIVKYKTENSPATFNLNKIKLPKVKKFIEAARKANYSDIEIYSYLNEIGEFPKEKEEQQLQRPSIEEIFKQNQ